MTTTTNNLPLDGERLLQIARDTGLRHHLHGVAPTAVRELLTRFAGAVMASTTAETMVRFCPGCGSVGAIDAKYLACCPDGDEARFIPQALAHKCRETFKMAIDKSVRVAVSVDTQAARRIIVDTLMQIADEAPINGNELAQARVRMAANRLHTQALQSSGSPGPLAAIEPSGNAGEIYDHDLIEVEGPGNYYGSLRIKREKGIDYWSIENHDGDHWYVCDPAVASAIRAAIAASKEGASHG